MEVRTRQRRVIEFLHDEKITPVDIHRRLRRPNSGCEHTEAVGGAFQQWRKLYEGQATFRAAPHSCQLTTRRAPRRAHPRKSAENDQGTLN
jgi:hypothetical protein